MNDCNFGKLYLINQHVKLSNCCALCVYDETFFVSDRKNIKLSKISSDAGRTFLRLREDWK